MEDTSVRSTSVTAPGCWAAGVSAASLGAVFPELHINILCWSKVCNSINKFCLTLFRR